MMMVTSARRSNWPGDIDLGEAHESLGLPIRCVVRTAKIAAIETAAVEAVVGRLPEAIIERVRESLQRTLNL